MKIAFVHLSDLHIKSNVDSLISRSENLSNAICDFPADVNNILIIVSGDVSFAATDEQYSIATQLFNHISSVVQEKKSVTPIWLIVPGNHDCDFGSPDHVRNSLVKSVIQDPNSLHSDFLDVCCKVQDRFMKFRSQYATGISYKSPLCDTMQLKIDNSEYTLTANLYNSAWMSSLDEKPGTLYMPVKSLPATTSQSKNLQISIVHHTLNWFQPDNARAFSQHLENSSHLIFTGHEHIPAGSIKTRFEDNISTYMYEGDALQEDGKPDHSGFKIIIVDVESKKQKMSSKMWRVDHYATVEPIIEWMPLTASTPQLAQTFQISDEFQSLINDPGAAFQHPRKSDLKFNDIYIPIDLKYPNVDMGKADESSFRKICVDNIKFLDDNVNHFMISGSFHSGKTKICHRFFKLMHAKGYIPIYIEAISIKNKAIESFLKLIDKNYLEQYKPADIDIFHEISDDKKLIIIDNYHCTRLNAKAKSELMASICNIFKNIIATVDTSFILEETVNPLGDAVRPPDLKIYQILPLGHFLRSRLITTWILLGQEDTITKKEVVHQHDRLQQTIDNIVGRNLVPSYPIFLLIILQRCENELPHDIKSSAYGYYYEYLIIQALGRINKKNEDIDAYYNYITELANYLFENKIRSLTLDNLKSFHSFYCNESVVSGKYL